MAEPQRKVAKVSPQYLVTMSPQELASRIRKFSPCPPVMTSLERSLDRRGLWSRDDAWYRSQKKHWLGWLSEYDGPGYYGRKNWCRSAEFVYNRVVCPPMVLWLAETAGISRKKLTYGSKKGRPFRWPKFLCPKCRDSERRSLAGHRRSFVAILRV